MRVHTRRGRVAHFRPARARGEGVAPDGESGIHRFHRFHRFQISKSDACTQPRSRLKPLVQFCARVHTRTGNRGPGTGMRTTRAHSAITPRARLAAATRRREALWRSGERFGVAGRNSFSTYREMTGCLECKMLNVEWKMAREVASDEW